MRRRHNFLIREQGVALVIALAFIVLLTGVIVAYFSRALTSRKLSDSSYNQAKADELARSALDIVTAGLKQEIENGSTSASGGGYTPNSPADMVPVRNPAPASPNPMPTLLRVSSPTAIEPPGVDYAASNDALSTVDSANGRSISLSRWNKHYLIPRVTGAGPTDTTPIPAFETVTPSWVYVTNQGPAQPPLVAPDSAVIGRYAYAIYDEGALLDVNVAGYPSALPASTPHPSPDPHDLQQMGSAGKGALAFADLTAIGMSASEIDSLVGWRNYASAQPTGDFASFTFDASSSARFYDAIQTDPSGFLKTNGTTWNNRTDQAILTRQQLLDLRESIGFNADALQYLGTFSRAVNMPTWSPSTPTGSTIDYAGAADSADSVNRNISGMRHTVEATIVHYRDDGTNESRSFFPGDQVLSSRFSLAKLAWLGVNGPEPSAFSVDLSDAERQAAILACFGLTWNASELRWDYDHGDANGILTLAEVMAQNREPDFFELLKAGILNGSLGKHPGEVAAGPFLMKAGGQSKPEGPMGRDFGGLAASDPENYYSGVRDRQILQIGANVIDQADPGNYPTAIYQDLISKPAYPEENLYNTVFGTENLPYLQRMGVITAKEQPNDSPGEAGTWLQPEVWNPHQNPIGTDYPSGASTQHATPSKLRLVTYGECYAWNETEDPEALNTGDPVDFYDDPSSGRVPFINSVAFFDRPIALTESNLDNTEPLSPRNKYIDGIPSLSSNRFIAVWTGNVDRWPLNVLGQDKNGIDILAEGHTIQIMPDTHLTFVLEYYDGSGWRPYSAFARIQEITGQNYSKGTKHGRAVWKDFGGRPDPRTDRFSTSASQVPTATAWNMSATIRADNATVGAFIYGFPRRDANFAYRSGMVFTENTSALSSNRFLFDQWAINLQTSDFHYPDPDGIVRPGDAFRADYSTGDGTMLYHSSPSVPATHGRRQVILNRPFRTVGELGYVFRDLPFKTLDFWSDLSADAGLLELFSTKDEPLVTAGRVNVNNASVKVLEAVISGAMKNEATADTSNSDDARIVATELAALLGASPIENRAELAPMSGAVVQSQLTGPERANKAYAEAPLRALSSVANFRTWNLMIDIVAQTGVFSPSATELTQFVVQGERRYWLHVAIDRLTGQVVDQQLEPVYE